jgi:hypothetical protein
MNQSDLVAPEAPAEAVVEAVPVLAQAPSSASPTQAPEVAEERVPLSLEEAARAVVLFVRAHRTIGDADLAAAVADVEAALPALPADEPVAQ